MASSPWRSRLLLAGLLVWAVCLTAWGLVWSVDARAALAVAATFGTFLLAGKLAAIPAGLTAGLAPAAVGLVVLLPDVGTVLFCYPLTETGIAFLGRWSHVVRGLHERAVRDARNRTGIVARYEGLGLFVLALTPVAFVSPLVVSAIGQMVGLSPRRVLAPVFAGMAIMTAALVVAATFGIRAAQRIDSRLPLVLTILIVVGILSAEVATRLRRSSRARRESRPPGDGGAG